MRVAVDVKGGDLGPQEIIQGALDGLQYLGSEDELVLFGPEEQMRALVAAAGGNDPRLSYHNCTQFIGMDESPVEAVRQKRDSTIMQMATAAGKGVVQGIISAGNTGAFAAACQFRIKTIPGVSRPGIGVVIPTFHGPVLLCDAGANVAPKPRHLFEYAHMGTCYARSVLGIAEPRIGLISIGEEETKGNPLVREARTLIKADPSLKYIGNVEGRDIFAGVGEVFVCDGFVGNVVLKLTEGLAEGLFQTISGEIAVEGPHLAAQFDPIVKRIWRRHDFKEYGGAPLLGLTSVVIICHGRSDRRAIANAVRVATEQIRADLIGVISSQLVHLSDDSA